jgi:thiol-disulfide isomerase/thioredoxin
MFSATLSLRAATKLVPALIPALLYATLALGANPAAAQTLNLVQRDELTAMRRGEMRKLVIHDKPIEISSEPYTGKNGAGKILSDSNGRIRLVNFWATWCAPCRREKPSLDTLQRDLGSGDFEVIVIATGRNDPDAIERFNAGLNVTSLETNLDSKAKLAQSMRVIGLPVTAVLNRKGQEIARLVGGADWSSDSARAIVTYLIALPEAP